MKMKKLLFILSLTGVLMISVQNHAKDSTEDAAKNEKSIDDTTPIKELKAGDVLRLKQDITVTPDSNKTHVMLVLFQDGNIIAQGSKIVDQQLLDKGGCVLDVRISLSDIKDGKFVIKKGDYAIEKIPFPDIENYSDLDLILLLDKVFCSLSCQVSIEDARALVRPTVGFLRKSLGPDIIDVIKK